jgi:hypothetical protein
LKLEACFQIIFLKKKKEKGQKKKKKTKEKKIVHISLSLSLAICAGFFVSFPTYAIITLSLPFLLK